MDIIIRMKSNTANLIPFATAAMVRYGATYDFYNPYGTKSEYMSVVFEDMKSEKEVNALLKQYGLLKSKKQYVLLKRKK